MRPDTVPGVPAAAVAAAFEAACRWDVAVRKPGNVSVHSAGHRMTADHFRAAAAAAAPCIAARGAGVGRRIEHAVAASWAVAGCNTNLGILLLTAPLARALEALPASAVEAHRWRAALSAVLAALDADDTRRSFAAIAASQPGGLGRVEQGDVHDAAPQLGLRDAMALAAGRDAIAAQYVNDFADVFLRGLHAWRDGPVAPGEQALRVQHVYLAFLAGLPDAHIVRKHGAVVAAHVQRQAGRWRQRAAAGAALDGSPRWARWDEALKARAINPGSSADLTVATLFVAFMLQWRPERPEASPAWPPQPEPSP